MTPCTARDGTVYTPDALYALGGEYKRRSYVQREAAAYRLERLTGRSGYACRMAVEGHPSQTFQAGEARTLHDAGFSLVRVSGIGG